MTRKFRSKRAKSRSDFVEMIDKIRCEREKIEKKRKRKGKEEQKRKKRKEGKKDNVTHTSCQWSCFFTRDD